MSFLLPKSLNISFVSNSRCHVNFRWYPREGKVQDPFHSWTDSGDASSLMAVLKAQDCEGKIQKDCPCLLMYTLPVDNAGKGTAFFQ